MKMMLDNKLQVLLLLNSLSNSWKTLIVSLDNLAPNGIMTLKMVKDSMLTEEIKRREQGVTTKSEALIIKR